MAANANEQATLADTNGLAALTNTDDQTAAAPADAAAYANAHTMTTNTTEHALTISANEQASITNVHEQAMTRDHLLNHARFIQIRLGDNSQYTVHRNILVTASPYFARCAMSMDPTGSHNMLNMAAHITYPSVFNIWYRWLYSARTTLEYKNYVAQAPIPQLISPLGSTQAVPAAICADLEYELLSAIYVLAFQLEDVTFQDAVLSAFIAKLQAPATPGFRALPGVRAVNDIYSFTPEWSKARTLMLQVYLVKATKDDITRFYHPEFLRDFVLGIMDGGRPESLELVECEYHTHAANVVCGLKKTEKRD